MQDAPRVGDRSAGESNPHLTQLFGECTPHQGLIVDRVMLRGIQVSRGVSRQTN